MAANMKVTQPARKKKGFTLIEVIAVLVLLGILAATAIPQYISLADTAKERAINTAVSELNGREALEWGMFQIQPGEFLAGSPGVAGSDQTIRDAVLSPIAGSPSGSGILGDSYTFSGSGNTQTITFQGKSQALTRTPATSIAPGSWAQN